MSRALFRLAFNHIVKSCRQKPRLRRTNQFFEPRAAVLEARQLLSASVIDVPRGEGFLYNPAGVLSDPSTASRELIAISFLQANYSRLGLTASDVSNLTVTSQYTEGRMSHVYLRQTHQNIQVMSADISVTMLTDGSVLAVGSQLVNGLASRIVSSAATFSAQSAIGSVANYFNQIIPTTDHISVASTTAQLTYVPGDDGRLDLAWNLQISSADGTSIGSLFIDAREGTVIKGLDEDKLAYLADEAFNPSAPTVTSANRASGAVAFNSITGEGTYRVFALPTQAPNDGSRVLVVAPADDTYSPYGWHDDDGIAGAEYTITMGNNAEARLNRFDDILGYGYQTDGGVDLNFDFPLDLTQDPLNSYDAALTQAFYTANMAHDIFAYYGFTEAAGNFQQTNYTGLGAGWDAIIVDVQTTTTFNNAIFFSSPEGSPPRMRLFLYNKTDPNRDIAFDNTIILHEYGHGVTKRLTGGANNIDVLDRPQSGSMGEGWSDFFALMLTQKATDTKYETYGLGTYVYGQETNEAGGRRQPYSYDMALNPLTYADFNHNNPVHYNGEIWASTLWDLNWKLIDKYGFSPDIKSGNSGNNLAMQLVMDALKIQSINPTFLEARDAILAADIALTEGANQSLIWEVFARRGMGYSAYDGGSAYALGTPAFDVPSPVGTVSLDKEYYLPGDTMTITVNDGSFASSTVTVEVTTNRGDRELVVLNLQAKGGYRGTLTTSRGMQQRGNGTLDLTPGDDIVVTYVDANTTSSTTAVPGIVYATAGALNRTFEADFEDGSGNSSLDGLTINNLPPSGSYAPGFWHLSSGRGTETGHSSTYSLYYGHGESATGGGTYDGPQPTQGEVVTPPVVIPPSAKLNFSYLLGRETNRGRADYFSVLISTGGGPYRLMVEKVPVTLGKFQTMSLDLADHTGETATFKFLVNTVDAQENFHEGWYLDDIVVTNVIDGDDQISEASTIRGNSSVLGSLGNTTGFYIGDVDLYRVNVQAGSIYEFNFDSLAANLDGTLRLFDASGNQLAISYDNAAPGETSGPDPYLSYTFSTAGAYYIGVSGSTNATYNPGTGNGDTDGSKGLYHLSVTGTLGDFALSNSTVAENKNNGTLVGTLSSTDLDIGNSFTYSLVSGSGSTNNSSFTISGNQIYTAASFDYEAKSSYSIRVRTTDQGGLWYEKVLTITITDVTEPIGSVALTNMRFGVAGTDAAIGGGYMMYSQQSVHNRFAGLDANNSDHLISVRYSNGQWQYDNNTSWVNFTAVATDRLVATINYATDVVALMKGNFGVVQGIQKGYLDGDLAISSNRWNGLTNDGEFWVTGTYITLGTVTPVPNLRSGIAGNDAATGTGYTMYSQQSVHTRFAGIDPGNADHLINVRYNAGQWQYDNNDSWVNFTPTSSDVLIAELNFTTDTITMLKGDFGVVGGITKGYVQGDLVITANRWNGVTNTGEYTATGTSIVFAPKASLGYLKNGIAGNDTATGSGYVMYSQQNIHDRFSGIDVGNADHLINVRLNGTQWQYDNNTTWVNFAPTVNDVLIAALNFTSDSITMLKGSFGVVQGVPTGYLDSDLVITANRWNGVTNAGEYGLSGSFITFSPNRPVYTPLTNLRWGVGGTDSATGLGYMMYSQTNVRSRFSNLDDANADHFINVRYYAEQWQYDNNSTWVTFTPTKTDRLVAELNFSTDTVNLLKGVNSVYKGITTGYLDGDLSITANQWNGLTNAGEYGLSGTYLTFLPTLS